MPLEIQDEQHVDQDDRMQTSISPLSQIDPAARIG